MKRNSVSPHMQKSLVRFGRSDLWMRGEAAMLAAGLIPLSPQDHIQVYPAEGFDGLMHRPEGERFKEARRIWYLLIGQKNSSLKVDRFMFYKWCKSFENEPLNRIDLSWLDAIEASQNQVDKYQYEPPEQGGVMTTNLPTHETVDETWQIDASDAVEGEQWMPETEGLKRRQIQIDCILQALKELSYPSMTVPTKGKKAAKDKCKARWKDWFGAGDSPFEGAWKEARKRGLVKMAEHDKFSGQ